MWAIYVFMAGIIVGIARVLRKVVYINTKLSMNEGFFLVIFGFLIGIISETIINIKKYNINIILPSKNKKYNFLMILSGILMFVVFKFYNVSIYDCKHPGWVAAVYAGVGVITTYIISVIVLNKQINIFKLLGILLTLIGITIILN